jgi:drug/metabolite transporter (DMT)-like permease
VHRSSPFSFYNPFGIVSLMLPIGIIFALLSDVLFGGSTPFAKLLLGMVDPWQLAGLLYLGAGFGLGIVQVSRGLLRLPTIESPLRRSDAPRLAAVVASGASRGRSC